MSLLLLFGSSEPTPGYRVGVTRAFVAPATPTTEVWVLDARGRPVDGLDFEEAHYTRVANGVGEIEVKLSPRADTRLLQIGAMLQVMRRPPGRVMRPRALYFIERRKATRGARGRTLSVGGLDANSVMDWRIFGPLGQFSLPALGTPVYPWSEEGVAFDRRGPLDDVLKYYARYSLDDAANYGPEQRSLRPLYGFTVEPDKSEAFVYHYSAKRKKMLAIAQDICKIAANPPLMQYSPFVVTPADVAGLTGVPGPFRLYFAVEQIGFGADFALQLRTRVGQLGVDHSLSGERPVVLSVERRTLAASESNWDHSRQVNHLYLGTALTEAEPDILQPYLADVSGTRGAALRRKEDYYDTGVWHLAAANTLTFDADRTDRAVAARGYEKLRELRRARRVTGDIPAYSPLQVDVDFGFGDRVVVEHDGEVDTVYLDGEEVTVGRGGEQVRFTMDYVDRPRRIRRGGYHSVDSFGPSFGEGELW